MKIYLPPPNLFNVDIKPLRTLIVPDLHISKDVVYNVTILCHHCEPDRGYVRYPYDRVSNIVRIVECRRESVREAEPGVLPFEPKIILEQTYFVGVCKTCRTLHLVPQEMKGQK